MKKTIVMRLEEATVEITNLTAKLGEMNAELTKRDEVIETLNAQLALFKQEKDAAEASANAKIEELEAKVKESTNKVVELNKSLKLVPELTNGAAPVATQPVDDAVDHWAKYKSLSPLEKSQYFDKWKHEMYGK